VPRNRFNDSLERDLLFILLQLERITSALSSFTAHSVPNENAVSRTSFDSGLRSLFFQSDSGEWYPLPSWAIFFFNLGSVLEVQPLSKERIVMGVALPARPFASSLAATGAVIASLHANLQSDLQSYFDELCKMPYGTGVVLLRNDKDDGPRQYPGVFAGLDETSLTPWDKSSPKIRLIRIQVSRSTMSDTKAGGRVFMVDAKRADTIRVLDPAEAISLKELPNTPSGSSVRSLSEFARRITGAGMSQYVARSKVVCLIVGSPGTLNREIKEVKYGVGSDSLTLFEGNLGEVLRVRRFSKTRRQFHSDIFTAASKWPPRQAALGIPDIVIFDGAAGFMKWRDSFQKSHLLIMLDQTEPLFMEAVQRLNYEYSCRLENDVLPTSFPNPQPGVELTFFREQIT
jgi:hypothetical protein